ncbi:MAG: methyltransferase domain-containing protein [Candidatus Aminicenantes bacterium]|nr:methyltransferase domain-containing protein [Candidatus Aminicenantes bacterium]
MNRKFKLILIAAFVLIGVVAFLLVIRTPGEDASPQAEQKFLRVGPKEITIRNVTKDPVTYTLAPVGSNIKPIEKHLAVGAVERVPTTQTLVVAYQKNGREVSYSLYPGKPYSFRYDSSDQLDIWIGAHGREDAEDLAPFVPTPPEVVNKMLELAKADKDSVIYDIGCGDGRILVTAAKKYGSRGVGIDIDPVRIKESKANARESGVEKLVKFREEDATKTDISLATIVTLYLLSESNELLRPKLERELKPGTLIVTHNYIVPGWEDKEIDSATVMDKEGKSHSIFLYKR